MSQRRLIHLFVLSMVCVAFCPVSLGQNCNASGATAWNAALRNVIADCAVEFRSPSGHLVLKIAADGRMMIDWNGLHWRGPQLEPPAMVSWSPMSDGFFVNDGEGSGMSSSFRLFRVKGTDVSEDKTIEQTVVSLFRQRVRCNSSAADPNVWGFGWNAQGSEIYLLVQPTANDSCGRPDQFISLIARSTDGKILGMLSKSQTKAKFSSRLPSSLFGK
jgi:hypothetical protein